MNPVGFCGFPLSRVLHPSFLPARLGLFPQIFFRRCWCGDDSSDYAKLGALDMTECARPCTGDADLTCGGFDAFQIFSLPAETSQGHVGCYADKKDDRLFKAGKIDLEENSVEVSSVVCMYVDTDSSIEHN